MMRLATMCPCELSRQSESSNCHGIHFAMVRSYQETHVPKQNFFLESFFGHKFL